MIVGEMEERMTNVEFVRWSMYYARRAQQAEVEQKMADSRGRR